MKDLGRIGVIGYGSQGRAQALNLRDRGLAIEIGLRRDSQHWDAVRRDGLQPVAIDTLAGRVDLLVFLIPDEAQPGVYEREVATRLRSGSALVFAHGFNIHYRTILPRPDLDVILVAPLAVGAKVRERFVEGQGVPALIACAQDASGQALARAQSYAESMGATPERIFESSFAEETETDLFAEQAILCGGLTHLILAGFETLVQAGYRPEIAYFSCLEEVKYMADLIQARGIAGMRKSISTTAEYGDYTRGPRVIGKASREAMQSLLLEIRSGAFARELEQEIRNGGAQLETSRQEAAQHPIETIRAAVAEPRGPEGPASRPHRSARRGRRQA
ncbi:ketol-acid reductoisomerase [mine drainage metagenome]|uniref:Ketol-acid reductoisomerase n=2 Tax=mine drainage metagenome TaxID=410659 RepID=T1BKH8_9ZZZZ